MQNRQTETEAVRNGDDESFHGVAAMDSAPRTTIAQMSMAFDCRFIRCWAENWLEKRFVAVSFVSSEWRNVPLPISQQSTQGKMRGVEESNGVLLAVKILSKRFQARKARITLTERNPAESPRADFFPLRGDL